MKLEARSFLALATLSTAGFATPADNLGAPFVVSNALNTQTAAAVAYNPSCDRFLVVWQDKRNGIDDDVWGTYVDGTGGGVLGTFDLTPRAGNQRAPSVAFEPNHDTFLVAWMDDSAGNWEIQAQNFDCMKSSVGPLIQVTADPATQQYPDVDCAYGLAWIVWQDKRKGSLDVFGQRVLPGGLLLGAGLQISQPSVGEQSFPAITANPRVDTGCDMYSFLTAWRDARAGNFDVYGHQLSDVGLCGLVADLQLYVGPAAQGMVDLDYGTAPLIVNDRYLVAWEDQRNGSRDVYARLFTPNGVPAAASFALAAGALDQKAPAVAFDDSSDEFLCVYQDHAAGNANIRGQRVGVNGAVIGGAIGVASNAVDELAPAVAHGTTADRYLIVWERGGDVFARTYWP